MKIHYNQSGSGAPLVIVHGLFGTAENWGGQVRALADHFQVYAVDLRNHGRSPWDDRMDYAAMADDLLEFLDDHGLDQVMLLGHSMGGKAAMQLALSHPARVSRLIVVDIAPVRYPAHHNEVFDGLFAVDLTRITSRGDAEKKLAERVSDPSIRQFLLKNLYRQNGHFAWRMNLKALQRDYESIAAAPSAAGSYPGPTLFIKGSHSTYIQAAHQQAIVQRFPHAKAKIIQGVGHWPHAEKPALFTRLLLGFLQE